MAQAMKPSTRYVTFGSARVRVRMEGMGAPLLLLMGLGGHLDMWQPLAEKLHGRQLVMFDFPGTGESTLPWFLPTMANAALFVRSLMRRLGLRRADVPGYSWAACWRNRSPGSTLAQYASWSWPAVLCHWI
jgi:poly(3-hydroxyoctanoate) depolymerase